MFLDIETTGMSPACERVTEIGALRVENGEVVARYSSLINPETTIPAYITAITHITDDMVSSAPTFADISSDLRSFLEDAIFSAHNVRFDYSFLANEYHLLGDELSHDQLDTVRLSRYVYPGHKSHRLDLVIERLGLEVINRHRAMDDAEVLWELFRKSCETDMQGTLAHIEKILIRANEKKPNSDPRFEPFDF